MRVAFVLRSVEVQPLFRDLCKHCSSSSCQPLPPKAQLQHKSRPKMVWTTPGGTPPVGCLVLLSTHHTREHHKFARICIRVCASALVVFPSLHPGRFPRQVHGFIASGSSRGFIGVFSYQCIRVFPCVSLHPGLSVFVNASGSFRVCQCIQAFSNTSSLSPLAAPPSPLTSIT